MPVANLVSIPHSGGNERAGVAGAAKDQAGLKYRQQGNCFIWIEDYQEAQKLINRQVETDWAGLLNGFAGSLNPPH